MKSYNEVTSLRIEGLLLTVSAFWKSNNTFAGTLPLASIGPFPLSQIITQCVGSVVQSKDAWHSASHVQVSEQPKWLVISSQSYPASRIPFPHTAADIYSSLQSAVHVKPAGGVKLGSHCSESWITPSPQTWATRRHWSLQSNPNGGVKLGSHCSGGWTVPSPQTWATRRHWSLQSKPAGGVKLGSHCSELSTTPFPQTWATRIHWSLQSKPAGGVKLGSHYSVPSITPSPHTACPLESESVLSDSVSDFVLLLLLVSVSDLVLSVSDFVLTVSCETVLMS